MRTISTYLDKNNQRTTKEKAWTIVTQVYNDAGNLQRTGYSKGAAQLAAESGKDDGMALKLQDCDTKEIKSFTKTLVKLGRDGACDLVIDLKSDKKKIDKVHVAFELRMGNWHVIDMSKGGVWVNDVKLAPNSPKALEKGDVINLAQKKKFVFM